MTSKYKTIVDFDPFCPWPYYTPYGNVELRVKVEPKRRVTKHKVVLIKGKKKPWPPLKSAAK